MRVLTKFLPLLLLAAVCFGQSIASVTIVPNPVTVGSTVSIQWACAPTYGSQSHTRSRLVINGYQYYDGFDSAGSPSMSAISDIDAVLYCHYGGYGPFSASTTLTTYPEPFISWFIGDSPVPYGGTATLSWHCYNGVYTRVEEEEGCIGGESGSCTVTIFTTRQFQLTCYNAAGDPRGTTTRTLTIEVLPSVKLIVVTEPDE